MAPLHPLALYVHVPFCRSKCGYCDFFSLPGRGDAAMVAYPDTVLRELEGFIGKYRRRAFGIGAEADWEGRFDTLFIGGGTPSILPLSSMERLLSGLCRYRNILRGAPFEWSVECNPESLTREHLLLFKEYGVTRISLGVQSFEEEALRAAGRPASKAETEAAVDLLAGSWEGDWSADLISGLPAQSRGGPAEDARRLCRAGASHISLYALTLEEGTPFHCWAKGEGSGRDRLLERAFLPNEEDAETMWFSAARVLADSGFARYEVSNFCRPGKACRHNAHYWRIDPYLGIGPGAVSTFLYPDGRSLRRSVKKDVDGYLASKTWNDLESLAEYETIDAVNSLKDYLLMSLRTIEGAHARILRERFGIEIEALKKNVDASDHPIDCLEIDQDGMRVTGSGLDRLNGVLIELFRTIDRFFKNT